MYDSVVSSLPTVASVIRNTIDLRGMQGSVESGDDRNAEEGYGLFKEKQDINTKSYREPRGGGSSLPDPSFCYCCVIIASR